MNHNIFNKWTIGAIGIIILIAAACYLYYQQTTEHDREQAAQAEKRLQQWKAEKESTETPAESITPTAEKPPTNTTQDNETTTAEMPTPKVSPFGLGEYPEIPKEWNAPHYWDCWDIETELLCRVTLKMHHEGTRSKYGNVSINYETGMILPLERGSVIIDFYIDENGEKVITSVFGHPDDIPQGIYTRESDIPSHLKIVTENEIAIDPYEYLGIPK